MVDALEEISKFEDKSLEVLNIISKLENGELKVRNVPDELALESDIIRIERKLGLRKSGRRGFDVITQNFFVEEQWFNKNKERDSYNFESNRMIFNSFKEYYSFLDGDVYENACYYGYTFEDEFLKSLNLDINHLKSLKSFETRTIDASSYKIKQEEIEEYNHCELVNKKVVKEWIDKFNLADTYDLFKKVCDDYNMATLEKYKHIEFFFLQYAIYHKNSRKHFDILMEYFSKNYYRGDDMAMRLCLIYKPDDVCESFNYCQASDSTNRKKKTNVKNFVRDLKNRDIEISISSYFDNEIHFYCEETTVYRYKNRRGRRYLDKLFGVDVCQAFETFEEFIEYRKGDLRNCDLSNNIYLNVDFSKCIVDDTTKLPIKDNTNLSYKVKKSYVDNKFIVEQFWYDDKDKCVKKQSDKFLYFFDFVAFLKGDLSGADLILCTGMKNLPNVYGINLNNVKMTSELCKQFKISYSSYDFNKKLIREFPISEKNEEQTKIILQQSREIVVDDDNKFSNKFKKISYISDLHLMHKIKNAKCKSKEDVIFVLQKNIDNILQECHGITLIGGDLSSEFSLYEMFIKMLRKSADKLFGKVYFVFVLGNHELWGFPGLSIEQIVKKYRTLLHENGMYLLQNDLFYENEYNDVGIIPYDELICMDNKDILEKLRCTRIAIFGGLGFSGYNEVFNALNGVYGLTIDRNVEIRESRKFEQLYYKLIDILSNKNTVIFTHMPKQDWCMDKNYDDNFVYVSGHTHRNVFFDDGLVRIYADNQIGYGNGSLHLKYFLMDNEYDCFFDYDDGIHEITSQQYQDFARGKNINMTFNRQINILYMLKKNGFYCFIHKSELGTLSMLNGGAFYKLRIQRLKYYYANMDRMIESIKKPLDKYSEYQQNISNEIKKIGGSGRIHGCIIDIDSHNHVYVNPVNMIVTGYYALDIINKKVYGNIPELLKTNCPKLYCNYMKMIEKDDVLILNKKKNEVSKLPQEYLETDIYKASREMKNMQKISYNVLSVWYDSILDENIFDIQ